MTVSLDSVHETELRSFEEMQHLLGERGSKILVAVDAGVRLTTLFG